MPHAIIHLGVEVTPQVKSEILAEAQKILSKNFGKPIGYCMSSVETKAMAFGGQEGNCAFVDVRLFGATNGTKNNSVA
ncbi:MAG: hypothetical protein EZS28_048557, partial [Streblomastix strix]